ncbi:heparinase II/III domain-containing protein [Vallitalea sp.]|jgi:hypothetical protein|uniref:heparinase II/III domain-containing protein n=1 Tax=Vallitalea sp. TaxID=1882829 RepID=UPI0025E336EF|nr:heparinase II/III family protein [Vallitalea sp.]MCT4685954.1 heparinase II/III-family protein [Vallitalea sp.]
MSTKKVLAIIVIFSILFSGAFPLNHVRAEISKNYKVETPIHNYNYDNYVGSTSTAVNPDGYTLYCFEADKNTLTGEQVNGKNGKSLKFTTTDKLVLYKSGLNIDGLVHLEANIKLEDQNSKRGLFELKSTTGGTVFAQVVSFEVDGSIKVNGKAIGETYTTNKWYNIKGIVDNKNKTMDVYINGEKKAEDIQLGANWVSIYAIKHYQLDTKDSKSEMYLDDIKVSNIQLDAVLYGEENTIFDYNYDNYEGSTSTSINPEGYTLYGFEADKDTLTGEQIAGKEGKSLKLETADKLALYRSGLAIDGFVQLEANVKLEDQNSRRGIFELKSIADGTVFAQVISFEVGGAIKVNGKPIGETYTTDKWYNIKGIVDNKNKTMDVYINGVQKVKDISLGSKWKSIFACKHYQVDTKGTSKMYLDDIKFINFSQVYTTYPTMASNYDNYEGSTTKAINPENYTLYGFKAMTNTLTGVEVPGKAGKSLKFSSNADIALYRSGLKINGLVQLEANVKFEDLNTTRNIFGLKSIASGTRFATVITFAAGGAIRVNGKDIGEKYVSDKWYNIKAYLDNENKTMDVFINGVTKAKNIQLGDNWKQIYAITHNQVGKQSSKMYLDDISISDLCPVTLTSKAWGLTTNGGFEFNDSNLNWVNQLGATGWIPKKVQGNPQFEVDSNESVDFDKSLKISTKDNEIGVVYKDVDVTAGDKYKVNSYVKTGTDATSAKVVITAYDSNDTTVDTFSSDELDSSDSFTPVEFYLEVPTNVVKLRVEHYVKNGTAWFDNTSVKTTRYAFMKPDGILGKYSSADVTHPYPHDKIKEIHGYGIKLKINGETQQTLKDATDSYMSLTEAEYIKNVKDAAAKQSSLDRRSNYEYTALQMAMLYEMTQDEAYARRSAITMLELANMYPNIPKKVVTDPFHAFDKYIPTYCVLAYDKTYNSTEWNKLSNERGINSKDNVEYWFNSAVMNMYSIHNNTWMTNITPYAIRQTFGTAVILNDPDMIRLIVPWVNQLASNKHFFPDGIYEDFSIDYHTMPVNNMLDAIKILELYKDPAGYSDSEHGIVLNKTNITSEWPYLTASKTLNQSDLHKFPNGRVVTINDTHYRTKKTLQQNNFEKFVGSTTIAKDPLPFTQNNFVADKDYVTDYQIQPSKKRKSLKFYSSTAGNELSIEQTGLNYNGDIVLKASAMVEDINSDRTICDIISNDRNIIEKLVEFKAGGPIHVLGENTGSSYVPGIWYDVLAILDNEGKKVTVFINGNKKGTKSLDEQWQNLDTVKFSQTGTGQSAGVMYLDNVNIYQTFDPNDVSLPIANENLNNIERWSLGLFGLKQGDTNDAMQASLVFDSIAAGTPYGGGHMHANSLGLILWGSGMEVLPDSGYPKITAANRYLHMDAVMHNSSWVWHKDAEPYSSRFTEGHRSSLLAYDPGTVSSKQVQLVEASQPGPVGDLVDMKRRLLLMVNIEGNQNYVVDLQRLKGGQAHEMFLRPTDEEDTTFSTSLSLINQSGNVKDYLASINKEEGLKDYRKERIEPKTSSGESDFEFTWTGVKTGTSLKAYMNGVQNSDIIFSKVPTLRRTLNIPDIKDEFYGDHFNRRRIVTPTDITQFASVYETWRKDENAKIQSVEWKTDEITNPDPMACAVVVTTDMYEDTIYISDDTVARTVNGITFSGKVAILRKDKTGGIVWRYIYGPGSVEVDGQVVNGQNALTKTVTSTTTSYDGSSPNTITVDSTLAFDNSLMDTWLTVKFGDGSGYGLKIENVNNNVIKVHDTVPFSITENGAKMLYFPYTHHLEPDINGDVTIEINIPTFSFD